MTDYNLFPPIRFRFYGDVEQAKGRIPQARTQMAQMIRRMEGLGRDSGQWQGQMPDGTQFRIAKMGDVHVADIFGVAPSVETAMPPVAAPYAAEGQWGDDVEPMAEMPDVTRQTIPDMSESPHISQRELLMRPHGELFGGTGSYLWVGAKIIGPAYAPDIYPTGFRIVGINSIGTLWADRALDGFVKYPFAAAYSGWAKVPVDIISRPSDPFPVTAQEPQVNLVLFEPDAASQRQGSIFQTLNYFEDAESFQPYLATTVRPVYFNEYVVWYNRVAFSSYLTDYPKGWIVSGGMPVPAYPGIGINGYRSIRGIYTTVDGIIFKKENQIPVHGYLCIDTNDPTRTRSDYYLGAGIADASVAHGWDVVYSGYSNPPSYDIDESVAGDGIVGYVTTVADYSGEVLVYESDMSVDYDDPHSVKADSDNILEGFYELRLSGGFSSTNDSMDMGAWNSVECEVYIVLGEVTRKYTVLLNATNNYEYSANAVNSNFEMEYPGINGTYGGLFNVGGWIQNGTPTPFDETWYPGCWLIDIKNQTIIHETDPANLDRPWFT